MPYLCTRIECGYIWDARGRTRKKARCPQCRSRKTIYVRHLTLKDIENFIKRRKQYLKKQSEKEIKPEPKKKEPKVAGRRKLQLKSGHIEYFHRRYREYKENQRMLMEPDRDPPHMTVRQWLMNTGISKHVADRWAMELLEKYKPKE